SGRATSRAQGATARSSPRSTERGAHAARIRGEAPTGRRIGRYIGRSAPSAMPVARPALARFAGTGYDAAVRAAEAEGIVALLPDLVNADRGLVRRGQRLATTFLLGIDYAA